MTEQAWSTDPYTDADVAELRASIAYWNDRRKKLRSPSLRTPHRSWQNNLADRIERQMQTDGHELWGMVIYRTTYGNDTDWTEGLHRLCNNHEKTLENEKGKDIVERFRLTVINDPAFFNGASTDDVRRHSQKWSVEDYKVEQPKPKPGDRQHPYVHIGRSARYHYAIQIDQESLHSIFHNTPALPKDAFECGAWVKAIDKSWYIGRSEFDDDPSEPIEGVAEEDVG